MIIGSCDFAQVCLKGSIRIQSIQRAFDEAGWLDSCMTESRDPAVSDIICTHDLTSLTCTAQISKSQEATGDNHAVSSLKFRVLRHFLQLGYAVFLSDVDIVTLQARQPPLLTFAQPISTTKRFHIKWQRAVGLR